MIKGIAKIRFKFNGKIYNPKDPITASSKDKVRLSNFVTFEDSQNKIVELSKDKFVKKVINK